MKVLLGVGNPLARDDAVGVWVAERLEAEGWVSIPARQAPENFLGKIERLSPELLVVVDAVEMGLPPGEIRRIPAERAESLWGSTHSLPLTFLLSRLGERCRVVFIGIQPKDLSLGDGLSPEVREGAERLLRIIEEGRPESIPELGESG